MSRWLSSSALLAVLGAAACAPVEEHATRAASEPEPPIAAAWHARCGKCHAHVEPGSRTHAELDAAFARHRARTQLTEDEWRALEDFLASDAVPAKEREPARGTTRAQAGAASIARR